MGGTEDLDIVERVGINNKSKKTKLGNDTPSDPIKTTLQLGSSTLNKNFSEQSHSNLGVTAVLAVISAGPNGQHRSKKAPMKKLIRVLLDSGSDGTYCSIKKEQPNTSPT